MDSTAWIALAIFMVVYVFIVSEKIHRTVIALTGAMLMWYFNSGDGYSPYRL